MLEATSAAGALAAFSLPTANDAVDATPAVACAPASGSIFPLGVTTVTCAARDAAGNSASATFTVTVTVDINVLEFTTVGVGALDQLRITYEILDATAPPFEFAFYGSSDGRFGPGDVEHGPRLAVTKLADRSVGRHMLTTDGAAYATYLTDLAINFFLTRADASDAVAESDKSNNDLNFIGIFYRPSTLAPLMIRGRDDTAAGGPGNDSLQGGSGSDQLRSDVLDFLLRSGEIIPDPGDLFCDALLRKLSP